MKLRPVSFHYTAPYIGGFASDPNWTNAHVGFIAEEVAAVDSRLITVDSIGRPETVRYENMSALLTKAVQEMNFRLDAVSSTTASTTPDSQKFAKGFFDGIFSRMIAWFADAANGITKFFAKEVKTDKLCIADGSGETCVTRSQLDALLAGAVTQGSSANPSNTNTSTNSNTAHPNPVTVDTTATSTATSTSSTTEPVATTTPAVTATSTPAADHSVATTTPSVTEPESSPEPSTPVQTETGIPESEVEEEEIVTSEPEMIPESVPEQEVQPAPEPMPEEEPEPAPATETASVQ
jgi:hypothetical protein